MTQFEERRKVSRLFVDEHVLVRVPHLFSGEITTTEHNCIARDLSPGGLRLISKDPIPVGERLEVVVKLEGHGNVHNLAGITRWMSPCTGEQGYTYGIELVDEKPLRYWRQQFH